mmetsp:Transcript_15170/g.17178  ORF Transcript_15170/g.17178 Transcript_15170/m.17178 type:complete len:210 (+) Transcript_15170:216-845(+)
MSMALLRYVLPLLLALAGVAFAQGQDASVYGVLHSGSLKRPFYKEYAKVARWLTTEAGWGVLATDGSVYNSDLKGSAPFANVMSYADAGTGTPIFYLTTLDVTARELAQNPLAAFTISEASLPAGCLFTDAEEPICAKTTFTGIVKPLHGDKAIAAARSALYKKHPPMMFWPKEHNFQVYTMEIKKIFFLDMYGGAKHIAVDEYYNATL